MGVIQARPQVQGRFSNSPITECLGFEISTCKPCSLCGAGQVNVHRTCGRASKSYLAPEARNSATTSVCLPILARNIDVAFKANTHQSCARTADGVHISPRFHQAFDCFRMVEVTRQHERCGAPFITSIQKGRIGVHQIGELGGVVVADGYEDGLLRRHTLDYSENGNATENPLRRKGFSLSNRDKLTHKKGGNAHVAHCRL
jgi:hypothetical protein